MDGANIGKTFISKKFSNTLDSFWIMVNPHVLINPFDFVSVDNLNNTKTIGVVKDLQRIFLSDDLKYKNFYNSLKDDSSNNIFEEKGIGVTIANIFVMANISNNDSSNQSDDHNTNTYHTSTRKSVSSINMPVEEGKLVVFASAADIIESLGVPKMEHPIPAGIIEMTNGTLVPIYLDVSYIFGPDTAHVNASGISGNMKTGYLIFLLQVIYHTLSKEGVAVILFNTKEKDLLSVDKNLDENLDQKDKSLIKLLNVELTPFQNVKYFLPRGKNGNPNSAYIPEGFYKTYSYELSDVYDRLELLFHSDTIYDPHYNISSLINYVYETWSLVNDNDNDGNISKKIKNWTDLINFSDYPEEIVTNKSTLLKFQGSIQRFKRPSTLFVDKKITSNYIGNEIKQLKKDDVFVIDIAMLSALEEQAFVIGDVMKTIDEMYSHGHTDYPTNKNTSQSHTNKPKYILILLDEINRFMPHLDSSGFPHGSGTLLSSAVSEEILKTLIAGKSRHTILLSAQQFKSQVNPLLNDNTGLHVITKLGLSELSTTSYSIIDNMTKTAISKLHRGEIILIHSAFRHPIKITIPKPTFKRP
ncbi:MAG TPA: hypothetical protein VIY08_15760 [Candidatus Nitrosocosmicus sp.]